MWLILDNFILHKDTPHSYRIKAFRRPSLVTENHLMFLLLLQTLTTRPLNHHSASLVESLVPYGRGVLVGRHDGLCQYCTLDGSSSYQLTGSDCDPIYQIATDSQHIYTACRDGMIRKYRSRDINV